MKPPFILGQKLYTVPCDFDDIDETATAVDLLNHVGTFVALGPTTVIQIEDDFEGDESYMRSGWKPKIVADDRDEYSSSVREAVERVLERDQEYIEKLNRVSKIIRELLKKI